MSKYLITGRPGSGKTTVIQELKRLGYRAFNTDELDDVTKLQHRSTGEVVPWPKRPVDWTRFSWNWQEDTLKKLLAGDADVFIGAVVGNQKDFYGLFDKIFVLTVTLETLTQRFKTHEYKRTSEGIKRLLAAHMEKQAMLLEPGVIELSGEQQLNEIINELLMHIGDGVEPNFINRQDNEF